MPPVEIHVEAQCGRRKVVEVVLGNGMHERTRTNVFVSVIYFIGIPRKVYTLAKSRVNRRQLVTEKSWSAPDSA
jgi:hypothetical protein